MLTANQVLQNIHNQGAQVKETIDSRSLLQKFRKMGLYRLLRANGHDVDENMEHDKMLALAAAFEDKLDFSKVTITPDGFGGFHVSKPIELVKEEQALDAVVQDEKEELKKMSRPDLMKLAKERGVTVNISMTVADLVAAITGTVNEQNAS